MPFGVKQDGEEYLLKNSVDSITIELSLYNESSDQHAFTEGLAEITTEPTGLTRQTATVTAELNASNHWEIDTDSTVTFDTSSQTENVDGYFARVNSTGEFLLTAALLDSDGNPRTVDLSEVDELDLDPGAGAVFVDA